MAAKIVLAFLLSVVFLFCFLETCAEATETAYDPFEDSEDEVLVRKESLSCTFTFGITKVVRAICFEKRIYPGN